MSGMNASPFKQIKCSTRHVPAAALYTVAAHRAIPHLRERPAMTIVATLCEFAEVTRAVLRSENCIDTVSRYALTFTVIVAAILRAMPLKYWFLELSAYQFVTMSWTICKVTSRAH